ncbi:glutathione S-transferase N-terminal domain-containing protein [Sagittula sp. S175]|uniref:glutathione S-transferase N-terminal domain-containing protein n=1 Tax=Sagittula sp. S175 TaxID=3415129 RepID=UPI003C7B994B
MSKAASGTLIIGDYAFSSWSLRGWLLFHRFDIPVSIRLVDLSTGDVPAQMPEYAPARTVPTWVTPESHVVWDSLAIAEELATRHPDAGIWPADPALRALARNLAAEMHSGFSALRGACPMKLRVAYSDFTPSEDVKSDLARIETLWSHALETSGGPWLAGDYSAADAFFAPVAARIATYDLPVSPAAEAYVHRHLNDPAFRRWRSLGLVVGEDMAKYAMDLTTKPWPGPAPRPARAVAEGTPENAACPYSGNAPTYLMEMDGRTFGFCNPTCRDKTVADPEAWPAFMPLV